ncbi:hypothetical protein EFK50_06505 [Nocardioides marmoriginsengisoli]|uniref:Indole-3-glycerol phosphate synthase n=1 Tax=Nocardioides marmoriginsengisoli TaxID=661483 RepID=A0A3N0CLG0_9ACTN|nr:hypothetical protein [Nocardioides marmoriginsengisoli]RNL64179.1 hypothetical protein EFK50_06505 [Nocardioides marmoriginsengisoli]
MSDYDVVLLVEQALTAQDAVQVRSLHEGVEDPVRYHLLLPVEDSATRIEAGMGSLATGDAMGVPALLSDPEALAEMQHDLLESAREALRTSLAAIEAAGGTAVGEIVSVDPIEGLAKKVTEVDAREAIILTRPHVVSEFFHLDWTSRARRKLGVPVLHLLEHETFDEQAGEGEGITGL